MKKIVKSLLLDTRFNTLLDVEEIEVYYDISLSKCQRNSPVSYFEFGRIIIGNELLPEYTKSKNIPHIGSSLELEYSIQNYIRSYFLLYF